MKTYPMNYIMDPDETIDGFKQTTIEAIKYGKRTSTTRANWGRFGIPNIGDVVKFINYDNYDSVVVKITNVTKIPKTLSKSFTDQWVNKERWLLKTAIDKGFIKGWQVEFVLYQP